MAVAARKAFSESVPIPASGPAPRLADETDLAGSTPVHDQHRALEAAFAQRSEHPRLRAVTFSLLTLASLGLWAAIIAGAVYVGRMVNP